LGMPIVWMVRCVAPGAVVTRPPLTALMVQE
jgi:hypothetical protein